MRALLRVFHRALRDTIKLSLEIENDRILLFRFLCESQEYGVTSPPTGQTRRLRWSNFDISAQGGKGHIFVLQSLLKNENFRI